MAIVTAPDTRMTGRQPNALTPNRSGGPAQIRRGRIAATASDSGAVQTSGGGVESPGFVVDPYRGPIEAPSLADALSSSKGFSYLRARFNQGISSMWAIALCTRKVRHCAGAPAPVRPAPVGPARQPAPPPLAPPV